MWIIIYQLKKNFKDEIKNNIDKEEFISKCEAIIKSSKTYDRHLFKEEFKKIFNCKANKYNFPINVDFLSSIITKRKNITFRFKKESALYDIYDNNNNLNLREFRTISKEDIKSGKKN